MTLLQERTANANAAPRVRAINCKSFKIGEPWDQYAVYFRENIRASHGLAHGDAALNPACCSWIGSKLEAGPTLTAYESLPDTVKNDWTQLNAELSRLYVNEEEKQAFLANVGGFKKGSQSLLAYKNELMRLVNLYQPDLHTVASEYQRQLVDRFIGGLDDAELQKRLRFHCRRDKMKIDDAFEFAVDYESTEMEGKVKELAGAARAPVLSAGGLPPAGSHKSNFSVTPTVGTLASSSSSSSAPMRILERSVDPKVKANEIAIEQIKATQAKTDDSIDILRKEFDEKFDQFDKKMDKLEFLLTASQTIQQQGHTAAPSAPPSYQRPAYQPRANSRPFRQQYQQGLTGGPGYSVDQRIRPNWPARPVSTEIAQAPAANVATQPQAGDLGACAPMPRPQPMPQPMPPSVSHSMPQPNPVPMPPPVSHSIPSQATAQPVLQPMPQSVSQPMFQAAAQPQLHPMGDAYQQAYPYQDEFWAEHLEYEATPVGYQTQPTGTYSYYPSYFH